MKKIIRIAFVLIYLMCNLLYPEFTFAAAPETTITSICLNDNFYYDVELMLNNGQLLLGVKQVADILEVPVKSNHSTKEITFNDIKISKTGIFKNGQKISTKVPIYLGKGMMDDVKDEFFCDEKILSQIFDSQISINKNDMSALINTEKELISTKIDNNEIKPKEPEFKAYTDVSIPAAKKKVSLDTIGFDNSMATDSASQIYQSSTTTNYMFNNNSRVVFKGKAYGGDFRVDLATNSYKQKMLNFGGCSFNYKNKYKKTHYEVGKVTGFRDETYQLGTQLIGAQIYNYNPKQQTYKDIEGKVDEKSIVNIYIDGEFFKTLNTYKGHYSLTELNYSKFPRKVEIEEVKEDGSKNIILTKNFPKQRETTLEPSLLAKEKQRSFIAGISGFNDRLFASDGYIYQMNTKKLLLGAREMYAINENLVSDTKFLYDKILAKSPNAIWGQNYYNSNSILSMGTFKNPNILEGSTIVNSLKFYQSDDLKLGTIFGISQSRDISGDNENKAGYTASLFADYKRKNYSLNASLYNQSTDFYLAGAEYGFISDRIGAKLGGSYNFQNWSFSGSYNKYYSNLGKKYNAGITDFDEISLNISGRIRNIAQVRFNMNSREGQNNIGFNKSCYSDLNIAKYFRNGTSVEVGQQQSLYQTKYLSEASGNSGFNSEYTTLYAKTRLPVMKNKGILELEHDNISYISNDFPNEYKMVKFNYVFPEMKRVLLTLGAGYKYTGIDKGFNYSASIGYRMKSGMVATLNYQYNTNGGYLMDNMYIPANARHSINLTMNDTYAVAPTGLKSIGFSDDTKGFVEVVAYMDKNNNGIFDEGDIGIENVPIKLSWANETVFTNKQGKIPLATVDKGVYKVRIDTEQLQATLSPSKNTKDNRLLMVQPQKQTNVEFKLISSVGNIKGNLKIIDDFGRNMNIKEFIIVLNDENGNEVEYSTVDDSGNYYFSGISPGKYKIMLDKGFLQENNLISYEDKGEIEVEIPFQYNDYVDINEKNLVYKCW